MTTNKQEPDWGMLIWGIWWRSIVVAFTFAILFDFRVPNFGVGYRAPSMFSQALEGLGLVYLQLVLSCTLACFFPLPHAETKLTFVSFNSLDEDQSQLGGYIREVVILVTHSFALIFIGAVVMVLTDVRLMLLLVVLGLTIVHLRWAAIVLALGALVFFVWPRYFVLFALLVLQILAWQYALRTIPARAARQRAAKREHFTIEVRDPDGNWVGFPFSRAD